MRINLQSKIEKQMIVLEKCDVLHTTFFSLWPETRISNMRVFLQKTNESTLYASFD